MMVRHLDNRFLQGIVAYFMVNKSLITTYAAKRFRLFLMVTLF